MNFYSTAIKNKMAILTALLLLISSAVFAQGWQETYVVEDEQFGREVLQTPDGGYAALSRSKDDNNVSTIMLVKTDQDGTLLNSHKIITSTGVTDGSTFLRLDDGSFIIAGYIVKPDYPPSCHKPMMLKTDAQGNVLWEYSYGGEALQWQQESFEEIINTPDGGFLAVGRKYFVDLNDFNNYYAKSTYAKISSEGILEWEKNLENTSSLESVIPSSDGNYLMLGYSEGMAHLLKIDPLGEIIWDHTYGTNSLTTFGNDLLETPDQHIMIVGNGNTTSPGTPNDLVLSKISPDGENVLFSQSFDFNGNNDIGLSMVGTTDGGYVLLGSSTIPASPNSHSILIKTDTDGALIWQKEFEYTVGLNNPHTQLINTTDGGFMIVGSYKSASVNKWKLNLIKTDDQGSVYARFLTGNVFHDLNISCNLNIGEPGLENWIVNAEQGGQVFYSNTDELGNYFMEVDSGTYELSVTLPSPYWTTCLQGVPITVQNPYDTISLDFPAIGDIDCPFLTVDIGTPFIRWCNEGYYSVSYCNDGTTPVPDAYVNIQLDTFLTLINSDLPVSNQVGNTFTFDIGYLGVNECGSFNIYFELGCDEDIQGFTHCTEAHIYPDSLCGSFSAEWDESSIEVQGICNGDSIEFIIINIGDGDMDSPNSFFVIEDQIILLQDEFQLESGEDTTITIFAGGATYRMEATQSVGHPGNDMPAVIIEGCGLGPFSLGFVNLFALNDSDNFLDIDCTSNISSFDPNDKQGMPFGYDEEHFILPRTDIQYKIRFQNTGTDTAFTVLLRDTLSPWLDVNSIRLGAASHAYDFEVINDGILKFTFNNILLPDSTTNEVASHGFVQFKISQIEAVPLGTPIYNRAGIYFDANSVVLTNTTLHTVQENFIEIILDTTNELTTAITTLKIYPNPTSDFANFEFQNAIVNGQFRLFANNGQLVKAFPFIGNQLQVDLNDLPKGIYFFEIIEDQSRQHTGKVLVK